MTERVGLLGWPVAHSVSPAMHNTAFRALGLDWRYDLLPVPPDELADRFGMFLDSGYRGFNVTVPHKHAVMTLPQVREVDKVAAEIGAANTLALREDGGLRALNTDWRGFAADLAAHEIAIEGSDCLILGTGGSSRAVAYALRQNRAARVRFVSRDPGGRSDVMDYAGLWAALAGQERLLIVNCTPVGMHPDVESAPWPDGLPFPAGSTLVDLIYNPTRTRLMALAEDAGAKVVGGLGMLVRQGALAFEAWTGIAPPIGMMEQAARAALGLGGAVQ